MGAYYNRIVTFLQDVKAKKVTNLFLFLETTGEETVFRENSLLSSHKGVFPTTISLFPPCGVNGFENLLLCEYDFNIGSLFIMVLNQAKQREMK